MLIIFFIRIHHETESQLGRTAKQCGLHWHRSAARVGIESHRNSKCGHRPFGWSFYVCVLAILQSLYLSINTQVYVWMRFDLASSRRAFFSNASNLALSLSLVSFAAGTRKL